MRDRLASHVNMNKIDSLKSMAKINVIAKKKDDQEEQ